MAAIKYRYGNDLDIDQVIELYHASTLGKRRPVDDRRIMSAMLCHANLVVTAWDGWSVSRAPSATLLTWDISPILLSALRTSAPTASVWR